MGPCLLRSLNESRWFKACTPGKAHKPHSCHGCRSGPAAATTTKGHTLHSVTNKENGVGERKRYPRARRRVATECLAIMGNASLPVNPANTQAADPQEHKAVFRCQWLHLQLYHIVELLPEDVKGSLRSAPPCFRTQANMLLVHVLLYAFLSVFVSADDHDYFLLVR